ncbi:MAG: chemotaxis protein CheW [Pirellulaceae bacterium]
MVRQSQPTPEPSAINEQSLTQFVGFRLAGQQYAFRIDQIQEIVNPQQVTQIPNAPAFVEGVSNLRGSIIPIINLRMMMGMPSHAADGETKTVVVNVGSRTIGCTVDSVTQVMRVASDSIQPPPDTVLADGADYITGFATVNEQLVVLLDGDRLLAPDKLETA